MQGAMCAAEAMCPSKKQVLTIACSTCARGCLHTAFAAVCGSVHSYTPTQDKLGDVHSRVRSASWSHLGPHKPHHVFRCDVVTSLLLDVLWAQHRG